MAVLKKKKNYCGKKLNEYLRLRREAMEMFCSNHSGGGIGMHLSKLIELYPLNECSLLHVIYTSIK